jgi:hypothetical protein
LCLGDDSFVGAVALNPVGHAPRHFLVGLRDLFCGDAMTARAKSKREARLMFLSTKLWEFGEENKITFDEWAVLMWRQNANLLRNILEPTYAVSLDVEKWRK